MGGKNHQPCRKFLPDSTRLSRFCSLAYAELELANVALEDLLLAELGNEDGRRDMWSEIRDRLWRSKTALSGGRSTVVCLRQSMTDKGFVDLAGLGHLNLSGLVRELAEQGLIQERAGNLVIHKLLIGGFTIVLDQIDIGLRNLHLLTTYLNTGVENLEKVVAIGGVQEVLEENQPGNIRPEFALLYTAWNRFNAFFLASSLIQTSLWYQQEGFGVLGEPQMIRKTVPA